MKKENISNGQEQSAQETTNRLIVLGEELLESSTKHTDVWKRATFAIPHEQTQEFYEEVLKSPIGSFFQDLKGYRQKEGSDKPYDWETINLTSDNPRSAHLSLEHFGPYKDDPSFHTSTEFSIVFQYGQGESEYYLKTKISHSKANPFKYEEKLHEGYDYWSISSLSFQHELFETGYEGSDFRNVEEVTEAQLKHFLDIFSKRTEGNQIKEQTLSEYMSKSKLIDEDTGMVFYWDPKRNDHFTKDGLSIKDFKSPLSKLPEKGVLQVTAQYKMATLEDGEVNPFI